MVAKTAPSIADALAVPLRCYPSGCCFSVRPFCHLSCTASPIPDARRPLPGSSPVWMHRHHPLWEMQGKDCFPAGTTYRRSFPAASPFHFGAVSAGPALLPCGVSYTRCRRRGQIRERLLAPARCCACHWRTEPPVPCRTAYRCRRRLVFPLASCDENHRNGHNSVILQNIRLLNPSMNREDTAAV